MNHPKHSVFPQDPVLELDNSIQILPTFGSILQVISLLTVLSEYSGRVLVLAIPL